jgi:hypothetical protein
LLLSHERLLVLGHLLVEVVDVAGSLADGAAAAANDDSDGEEAEAEDDSNDESDDVASMLDGIDGIII